MGSSSRCRLHGLFRWPDSASQLHSTQRHGAFCDESWHEGDIGDKHAHARGTQSGLQSLTCFLSASTLLLPSLCAAVQVYLGEH